MLPAQVYPPELVAALKTAIDTNLESELETAYERIPFQGSSHQINNVPDPSIVRMLSHPAAVEAMAQVGCTSPKYRDGYILSKPGKGHALYWYAAHLPLHAPAPPDDALPVRPYRHRDWSCWLEGGPADEETVSPFTTQMFLMLYLVDSTPHNGCLRVIPGASPASISRRRSALMIPSLMMIVAHDPSLRTRVQDRISAGSRRSTTRRARRGCRTSRARSPRTAGAPTGRGISPRIRRCPTHCSGRWRSSRGRSTCRSWLATS